MMRRVDPFITASGVRQPAQENKPVTGQGRSIDGVLSGQNREYTQVLHRHAIVHPPHSEAGPKRPSAAQALNEPPTAPIAVAPKQRLRNLQAPFILLAAMAGGFALQSLIIGQLALVFYAIFALVKSVSSYVTFLLAVLALVGTAIVLVARPDTTLAANFAVYAFLLLAIGLLSLGREIRREIA